VTRTRISYGKLHVPVQRVGIAPLHGLPAVPESALRSLDSPLLAASISMEVLGDAFLASYTEGDNSRVVATDTMKNVILQRSLAYGGATMDGLLDALGRHVLAAYPDMDGLRLRAEEIPFERARIGARATISDRLFSLRDGDHAVAELELARDGDGATAVQAGGGQVGLRLLKTTGSSFTRFARDDATTLPERVDRPLYVHLDVAWRYADPADALAAGPGGASSYVAAAQVRDVLLAVFEELVSESIQQLVHVMGQRLLERYPALAEVSLRAENRTHDPVAPADGAGEDGGRAYTAPFPAWGLITLTLSR
jgi:urate oxidase